MLKVLVICPYEELILKAIVKSQVEDLGKFIIIGSKKKIIEICYMNNICYNYLTIMDSVNNFDICDAANNLLKQEHIDVILMGNLPKQFQKNIYNIESDITIISVPQAEHILIVPQFLNEFVTVDDKKQAILKAKEWQDEYDMNYLNIGLVTGVKNNTLKIEKDVIKMDEVIGEYDVEVVTVSEVMQGSYNILIFNNNDAANIFIETISLVDECKCGHVKKASKHFVIDACNMTYPNIYFSVFLISKMKFNTEAR